MASSKQGCSGMVRIIGRDRLLIVNKAVVLAVLGVLAGLASRGVSQDRVTWEQFSSVTGDLTVHFSRAAAGRLIKDSPRPQVVFVVGDGDGPLNLYEWVQGTWVLRKIAGIHFDHSLQIADFDGDGNLDIFVGEQRLDYANGSPRVDIFVNQGSGKS